MRIITQSAIPKAEYEAAGRKPWYHWSRRGVAMPICQRVLSVSIGKSSVVDVSAESPPAHASRAGSGQCSGSRRLKAAPEPNLSPWRAPSMPTVGMIARYRLAIPLSGPWAKSSRSVAGRLTPRNCICVCTVFIGSSSEACTIPAAQLAMAARVGSPDSASDVFDLVRFNREPTRYFLVSRSCRSWIGSSASLLACHESRLEATTVRRPLESLGSAILGASVSTARLPAAVEWAVQGGRLSTLAQLRRPSMRGRHPATATQK